MLHTRRRIMCETYRDANRRCMTDKSPHVIPYAAVIATNPSNTITQELFCCATALHWAGILIWPLYIIITDNVTDQTIKKMDQVSTDPDTRVGVQWAHTCNMRSNCRCSCVLQFTLCHAFSCVLHRPPIQLIHCMALYRVFSKLFPASRMSNITSTHK